MTESQTDELVETWVSGNRKDVAAVVAKLKRSDVVRFAQALSEAASPAELDVLAKLIDAGR